MPKDLSKYSKEFGDYLTKKGKSRNTVKQYSNLVFDLLIKTEKPPQQLTLKDIEEHLNWIRSNLRYHNKKTRFSGIKKYLKYLKFKYKSTIYDEYLREIETTDEDMFYIKEKHIVKSKNTLTSEEVQRLFRVSEHHTRNLAILKLFYHSWQRVGSIQNLNISDIDFNGEVNPKDGKKYHKINIISAKNNQSYFIYVETEVIEAINKYLTNRENPIPSEGKTYYNGKNVNGYIIDNYGRKLYHKDAVFLNGNGQRLMSRSINNMMKKYAIEAKIEKRMFSHLWRASGITISENNGVPISQIMKRSGHTNIISLKTYLNPKKNETNMRINNALNNKNPEKLQIESGQEQRDNPVDNVSNTDNGLKIELLKLELSNKKAEIELLKLKQIEKDNKNPMFG